VTRTRRLTLISFMWQDPSSCFLHLAVVGMPKPCSLSFRYEKSVYNRASHDMLSESPLQTDWTTKTDESSHRSALRSPLHRLMNTHMDSDVVTMPSMWRRYARGFGSTFCCPVQPAIWTLWVTTHVQRPEIGRQRTRETIQKCSQQLLCPFSCFYFYFY